MSVRRRSVVRLSVKNILTLFAYFVFLIVVFGLLNLLFKEPFLSVTDLRSAGVAVVMVGFFSTIKKRKEAKIKS